MKKTERGVLLRVFIGETERRHGRPVYETVVMKARELEIRQASVFRGILGYGTDNRLHAAKLLALSDDLPVVVELVDTEEKVASIMPFLDEVVAEGFVTSEVVEFVTYRTE